MQEYKGKSAKGPVQADVAREKLCSVDAEQVEEVFESESSVTEGSAVGREHVVAHACRGASMRLMECGCCKQ